MESHRKSALVGLKILNSELKSMDEIFKDHF